MSYVTLSSLDPHAPNSLSNFNHATFLASPKPSHNSRCLWKLFEKVEFRLIHPLNNLSYAEPIEESGSNFLLFATQTPKHVWSVPFLSWPNHSLVAHMALQPSVLNFSPVSFWLISKPATPKLPFLGVRDLTFMIDSFLYCHFLGAPETLSRLAWTIESLSVIKYWTMSGLSIKVMIIGLR